MRRHSIPLALLMALALPPALAGQTPVDPTPAFPQALVEAEASLAAGEVELAESHFRAALLEGWLILGTLETIVGDLPAAEAAFKTALGVVVETRRAKISLALARLRAGKAPEAIMLLRTVVGADTADLAPRRLLAQALGAAGAIDEAIQEITELRALDPDNLENAFLLATAYLKEGKVEAAEQQLSELIEQRPIPQTYILLGRTYRDFGLYERAGESLRTALRLDPGVRRAHYYLGTIHLLEEGQLLISAAIDEFIAELELAPADLMSSLWLGMALVEERRYEEAVPPLERATSLATMRKDALQFLGRSYLALGRTGEAVKALREALELAETETREGRLTDGKQLSTLHYQLASALRRTGSAEEAAVHFAAAKQSSARATDDSRESLRRYLNDETEETDAGGLDLPLEFPDLADLDDSQRAGLEDRVKREMAQSYFNLGVLKLRAGRFRGAAELLEQAAALAPDLEQVQYSLGTAHFNAGQFDRAIEPLALARQIRPSDADLRRMLAMSWWNAQGYEEAIELLQDDEERRVNPSLQYVYGLALVRSGRAAEAEVIFGQLLQENADWPELRVVLGQAFAQQGDYGAAIESLERAIELQPDVAEAHSTLGDIYLRQGKLEEAVEVLRIELRSHPGDTRARYTLGVVLNLAGHHDEAIELLGALLKENPTLADARYLLGKILLAEDDPEASVIHLEAAALLSPNDADTYYQLGRAYQRLGRRDEAQQAFETSRRVKSEGQSEVPQ